MNVRAMILCWDDVSKAQKGMQKDSTLQERELLVVGEVRGREEGREKLRKADLRDELVEAFEIWMLAADSAVMSVGAEVVE